MKWIHLKDFTADFLLEEIKKGIESEAFKKQLENFVTQCKKTYQPGDVFHITPHFKLPDFQVLPDKEENNHEPKTGKIHQMVGKPR